MTAPDTSDDFLAKGKKCVEIRRAAFDSYSRAADLVRERLKELVQASREGQNQATMDHRERELMAAERLKDLTVLEVQHADDNWREWKEEVARRREEERWHHEEQRQTRQEKTTTSAKWAAWFSFLAAFASVALAAWQVFAPWWGR